MKKILLLLGIVFLLSGCKETLYTRNTDEYNFYVVSVKNKWVSFSYYIDDGSIFQNVDLYLRLDEDGIVYIGDYLNKDPLPEEEYYDFIEEKTAIYVEKWRKKCLRRIR